MANNVLRTAAKQITKDYQKRAMEDFAKCATQSNVKIAKELNRMYKEAIDEFYKYRTKTYIRNLTSQPGLGYGVDLYWVKIARSIKSHHAGVAPKLIVATGFDPSELEVNIPQRDPYEYHDPEEVVSFIMNGIRFARGESDGASMSLDYRMPWKLTRPYNGEVFSLDGDTLTRRLSLFKQDWNRISQHVFYDMWGDYVSEWVN